MKTCTAIVVATVLWICAAPSELGRANRPISTATASDTKSASVSTTTDTTEGVWIRRQREERLLVMEGREGNTVVQGKEGRKTGA